MTDETTPAGTQADSEHGSAVASGRNRSGGLVPLTSRRAVRLIVAVLASSAILTVVAMVWLWPDAAGARQPYQGPQRVNGQVVSVRPSPCPSQPEEGGPPPASQPRVCGTVVVRLSGAEAGREIVTDLPSGAGAQSIHTEDKVVLLYLPDSLSGQTYQILGHQRGTQLWILVAAFALAIIAFGRWRGLSALAGLAVTFAVLLLFVVPAILEGSPPLLVAIVGSSAIVLAVLYLTHGFTVPTSMAVLGTLVSLTLTGLLSGAATAAAHLSGVAGEDDIFLAASFAGVNMQGLLLAGILIGSLGVLDDVTVTQAYTVTELAHANPDLGVRQLYRRAARVGRAHIASVVNTIVLAYAGASLPLLLLIVAGNQPLADVLTNQTVAQEIVRSVVGTLGLIAAVPITTALAALTARRLRPENQQTARRRRDSLEVAWGLDHDDGDTAVGGSARR